MKKALLPLTLLILVLFLSSCGADSDMRSAWKCPDKPIHGRYIRNPEAVEPNPISEYIELLNDSVYFYYYEDHLHVDSIRGTYTYNKQPYVNKKECQIILEGLQFPYEPESSTPAKHYARYGVTESNAFIDKDAQSTQDYFILVRK